ncbi:MAG: endolytic transglycosylase MltG [Nocardioidaceae bacterium]
MSDLGIDGLQQEGRKPGHKHGRGCLAVLVALAVIVALGVLTYTLGVGLIKDALSGPADYKGHGHGSVVVEVKKGDTATDIGATLLQAHVVKSQSAFTEAAKKNNRSVEIQVGYYRLHKHMSGASALSLLLDPKSRVDHAVTIPEGKRAKEILAILADRTNLSKSQLHKAFRDTVALHLPSYAHGDPEGYLFPATYDVAPGMKAPGVLREMTRRFKQEAATEHLIKGAHRLKRSPAAVVKVASLVQAEARRSSDMPKVARVIYNRLDAHKPLQMDSTLHYAVDSRGEVATSGKLRKLGSPYNSYRHTGLPPTPIDSPGAKALHAALHPAHGKWRYFVTVNLRTGETKFSTTYKQHLRNVQELHKYCRTSDEC